MHKQTEGIKHHYYDIIVDTLSFQFYLKLYNCTSAHWLCEWEPWAAWTWKIISGLSRWLGWAGGVDRQRQRPRVSLATLRAEVVWAQVSGGRGTGDMSTMNDVHQFRSRTPSFLISAEPPTQVHTSIMYRRNIYLGSAFCLHNKSRCMGK